MSPQSSPHIIKQAISSRNPVSVNQWDIIWASIKKRVIQERSIRIPLVRKWFLRLFFSQRARTSSFWEYWINKQVTSVGWSQRMSPQLPIHPIHQVTISHSLWGKNMLLSLGKDAIRQRFACPCTNLHKCVDIGKQVNVRLSSPLLSHGKNTTPSAA